MCYCCMLVIQCQFFVCLLVCLSVRCVYVHYVCMFEMLVCWRLHVSMFCVSLCIGCVLDVCWMCIRCVLDVY